MGSKFYFFTDPALLGVQATTGEAYGPSGTSGGKDGFRVTDLHQRKIGSTDDVPAFAICNGLVCAQAVPATPGHAATLNLILRPLQQPPFDFPYVEYLIYRGIDPASFLDAAGNLDLSKEGTAPSQNDLIQFIRIRILKQAAGSGTTEAKYIGLNRVHDASAGVDGGVFGDAKPIDHLFRYPAGAELPIVQAGWKLGQFLPASFGIEVVVQTYGSQPKLGWARRDTAALIEVDTLGANATDNDKYRNRLARETIGCFVDPCAFWGMFFDNGLCFRYPTHPADDRKPLKGKPLCDKLFAAPAPFINQDRLYLNVRNETGYSYNFYRNYQDAAENSLQIGPDSSSLVTKKYGNGWPVHFEDQLQGHKLCFRLHCDNAAPLLFRHQTGSRSPGGKRFTDKSKLLDPSKPGWTKPITFTRPNKSGARPPWCFVAHYLRQQDGSAAATSPIGVFDTTPLQFGPVGDRVIAAYNELWTSGSAPTPSPPQNYKRVFISDKVLRYEGGTKPDPTDPTTTGRSFTYDRVGDTFYILQKGIAPATTGKDSVVIVQRRQYAGRKVANGTWKASNAVSITSANRNLFVMLSASLSQPVFQTLNTGSGPVTVPTYLELINDTQVKADLFDFTFMNLSKTLFGTAVAAAKPVSPNPAPTEEHALFLSLSPQSPSASSTSRYSAYDVECRGWDGQTTTSPLPASAKFSIYSADGVFFSSSDFDRGSLVSASPYIRTPEEDWVSRYWDELIDRDQMGGEPDVDKQMGSLVTKFASDLADTVAAATSNPDADLLTLLDDYGRKIWDRAVLLGHDTTLVHDSHEAAYTHQEWSDRILYGARAKMEVALRSNPYVHSNPVAEQQFILRFEESSRNFGNLSFSQSNTSEKRILLTGFDPYGDTTEAPLSNPSGKLALFFANSTSWKYNKVASYDDDLYIRTCIFPVRWKAAPGYPAPLGFDEGLVETIIGNAIDATIIGKQIQIVCTCSLDPTIEPVNDGHGVPQIHFRIERFAGKCRDNNPDNNNVQSSRIEDATLPTESEKNPFYVSKLELRSATLSVYDGLAVKLRYNELYTYYSAATSLPPSYEPSNTDIFNTTSFTAGHTSDVNAIVAAWKAHTDVTVTNGSGAAYLSNEIFYRVSNLVQSNYTPANAKYTSLKNGHIHVPEFETKMSASPHSVVVVTVDDLADSVLAVLDGVQGL
jgi:hypothetical protein